MLPTPVDRLSGLDQMLQSHRIAFDLNSESITEKGFVKKRYAEFKGRTYLKLFP